MKSYRAYTVSEEGTNLVKHFEGLRLEAYYDHSGRVWTIGWGHTRGVKAGQRITREQAEQFLRDDLDKHMEIANGQITTPLTQNQYDAIASFCLNLGAGIFKKYPKLLAALNNNQWENFCKQLQDFKRGGGNVLPGLVKRRQAEADWFMKDLRPAAAAHAGAAAGRPAPAEPKPKVSHWIAQVGIFKPNRAINLRNAASASTVPSTQSPAIAKLGPGSEVHYDAYCRRNGYLWIRQPRKDGSVGLMATGTADHEKRTGPRWGSFT